MRLPHRRWHRLVWTVLPVIVLLLCAAALVVRPSPDRRAILIKEGPPR